MIMDALFCFRATFLVAAKLFRLKTFAQIPPDPDSCCQMLNETTMWQQRRENLPHYLPDKSQTLRGDSRGSPHSPNERSQVCANCPRDPYLSPTIKPIPLLRRPSSYFVFPSLARMLFVFLCCPARFARTQSPVSHLAKYISSFDLLLPDFTTPNKLSSVKRSNQS